MNLIIELANGTEHEIATKERLLALLKKYDLRKWLFTKRVRIEQGAVPHSHPVLTLNTRCLHDDSQLLATFIHEQLHWFTTVNQSKADAAIAELRVLYPKVPVGYPEGARSEESTYMHLIIGYLEHRALMELVGVEEANRVFDFLSEHHYTWIYKTVRADGQRIGDIVQQQYKLVL